VQDAEDTAHAALTRAFDRLDTLEEPRATLKWVHRIVGNAARDHYRNEDRRMAGFHHADTDISEMEMYAEVPEALTGTDSLQSHQAHSHHLPDELVARKEVNRIIFNLVEELPPRQRQVVMMYYYAELSTKEIAEDLNMDKNAVGGSLFRARETLNARIREVEETQDIHLFGATTLPLMQVLKEAAQAEIEPPVSSVGGASDTSGAMRSVASQHKSPMLSLKGVVAISATTLLLLAGGVYALNSNTPDLDDVAVSMLDTSYETTQTAKRPASPNTDPKPSADDSPSISDADGSDKPSPVAPAPLYEIVPETQDDCEFFIEFTEPAPPAPSEVISEHLRMPGIGSLVRFGVIEGTFAVWEVTAKTETTLTMAALQDTPVLDSVLSPSERATILNSTGTTRPTIQLDGYRLNFVIRDGVCYAEPI